MNQITFHTGVCALEVIIISVNDSEITYHVKNTPICQYDQHSRARVGIKFFDYIVSDKPEYVVYTNVAKMLLEQPHTMNKLDLTLQKLEKLRINSDFKDQYNLMTRNCEYKVTQTWQSLRGQMSRRLKFCEEEFIVGLHWLLRDKLIKMGFKHAESFLPSCDVHQDCDYASADYLSNMFGCLFAGCGRWKSHAEYASFNESCTTAKLLENQLSRYNVSIPQSDYEKNI